jgi:hypothetical protein
MLRTQDKRVFVGDRLEMVARGFRTTNHELLGDSGDSHGVVVTASASADTKGAYTALGTTTFDCDGFYVQLVPGTATRNFLVDIAIGGAGSEVVILSNMLVTAESGGNWVVVDDFYVPLPLPAGTAISARCQSHLAGSDEIWCSVVPVRGESYYAMRKSVATTYGATTATTRGTTLDPGASADTNGAIVELSASVSRIDYALICAAKSLDELNATASWYVEACIGAASSEVAVIPGMQYRLHSTSDIALPNVRARFAHWPAGARLSARARCSVTTTPQRVIDVVVIGFS